MKRKKVFGEINVATWEIGQGLYSKGNTKISNDFSTIWGFESAQKINAV